MLNFHNFVSNIIVMAYSQKQKEKIFETVFSRIEDGEALRNILKDKDMPSTDTFYIWLDKDETKSKQYVRACNYRADAIFEECLTISDNLGGDLKVLPDGSEVIDQAVIQRDRLRVDTRKWMAGKLRPSKYGDKIGVEHSGEVKTESKTVNISIDGKEIDLGV